MIKAAQVAMGIEVDIKASRSLSAPNQHPLTQEVKSRSHHHITQEALLSKLTAPNRPGSHSPLNKRLQKIIIKM